MWNLVRANSKVARRIYEVWRQFMNDGLDELCEFVSDYYNYAKPSIDNNRDAGFDDVDYSAQASRAVSWLRQRAAYISQQMAKEFAKKGDVNGDRIVSIEDVTRFISYLLDVSTDTVFDAENADVNSDGMLNIADVTALIYLLLS